MRMAAMTGARLTPRATLSQLGLDPGLLQQRQVLDEYLAIEVIDLVLDAYGQRIAAIDSESGAVLVLGAHAHPRGPAHLVVDAGHREATLFTGDQLVGGPFDHRIDEHAQGALVLGK